MRRNWTVVLTLLLVAVAAPALAGNCGGGVPCQCGDTVTASYTLAADLGPCPGHGLVVRSQVTLDCQGRRISGSGNGTERYGVYLRGDTGAEVRGATVRNCQVTGFHHGIRLRAAEDSQVLDNHLVNNGDLSGHVGYGVDVTVGSRNNLLRGNRIEGNADEGVHLASGTALNDLVANAFVDNYREQIYLLESHGNRLIDNVTSGSGSNSLYLKDSRDNRLEGNVFRDRVATVIGGSSDNLLIDNTFVNAQLQFRAYDASPDRIPVGNTVLGGSMSHASGTCLRFSSARGNLVADVALTDCAGEVSSDGTADEPSENTVIGIPLRPGRVSLDGSSTLLTGWWLAVRVEDSAGAPVAGARVRAIDATGEVVVDAITDGDGRVPAPQWLAEQARVGGTTTARTPHQFTTSRGGYRDDVRAVAATDDVALTVVLSKVSDPPGGGGGGGNPGGGDDSGGGGGNPGGGGDPGDGGGDGITGMFTDDFARPDSPALGDGWAKVKGDLAIAGGSLQSAGVKGYNMAVVPGLAGATQDVAADFVSTANEVKPRFGLVLRYRDPRNYYAAYWQVQDNSTLRITRVLNGVERTLVWVKAAKPTPNVPFRLSADANGSALTLSVDGVRWLTATDDAFAEGGTGIVLGAQSTTKLPRAEHFAASAQ